jgi:hypothetical protein
MNERSAKNMSPRDERAERLAAKLRENLRRRKAQARAAAGTGGDSEVAQPLPNCADEG